MTAQELFAFHAGIRHAADMALASALMLEIRSDARQVRQRAAIEALRGLADGLRASLPTRSAGTEPVQPIQSGEAINPIKSGLSAAPEGPHDLPTSEQAGLDMGTAHVQPVEAAIPVSLSDQRHASIAAGYSGDACTNCQNFTLRRAGTCLSCDTCGSTTGCS